MGRYNEVLVGMTWNYCVIMYILTLLEDTMKEEKLKVVSMAALALVALSWGTSYAIIKDTLTVVRPFTLMLMRFGFSAVLLGVIFFKRFKGISRKSILKSSLIGFFMFSAFICLVKGIEHTTASKQSFLVGSYVLIVPFISWLITKKRPGIYAVLGAVMATAGIGMLTLDSTFSIGRGDVLSIICSLGFALHMIAIEYLGKDTDPIASTIIQFTVTAVLFGIISFIFEPGHTVMTLGIIKAVAYLVVVTTVIAFTVQNIAQRYISSTSTALILTLESAFGGIFALFYLHESMNIRMVIGCLVIFIGIITEETRWSFLKGTKMR